jgi:hypothetical protein
MGPTIVLPLPAMLANTLSEDMEIEASYLRSNDSIDENAMDKVVHPNYRTEEAPPITSLPPDDTIRLDKLNTDGMLKKIKDVRQTVTTMQTTYQLCPNVPTLDFAYKLPHYLSYNPVDTKNLENKALHTNNWYGIKAYNCTSLVADILHVGGSSQIKAVPPLVPWALTPNELGDQLLFKKK